MLNRVPYISTISSCAGHFDADDVYQQKYAHVIFEVPDSRVNELELMLSAVLQTVSPGWPQYGVEVHRRYYVQPDEKLQSNWKLLIMPFEAERLSPEAKRNATDAGIMGVERSLESYIAEKGW